MTLRFADKRRLLPRWKFLATGMRTDTAEIASHRQPSEIPLFEEDLRHSIAKWEAERNWESAAELVSSAIILRKSEEAVGAASLLLDSTETPPPLVALSRQIMGLQTHPGPLMQAPDGSIESFYSHIALLKGKLVRNPRNSLLYLDLALSYASLGQTDKAAKAIEIALHLAPSNRLVIRSSSRFFAHTGDLDHALTLVRRSARRSLDPWLISSEIEFSAVVGKSPRLSAAGKQLLQGSQLLPMHYTELATALGSLELRAGKTKKGMKLMQKGLEAPTENVVAQAQWWADESSLPAIERRHFEIALAHEARAMLARQTGDWAALVEHCELWAMYETFSQRPYEFASYIATLALNDPALSEKLCERGLRPDPTDRALNNNLAVALALQDRPDEALARLALVSTRDEADASFPTHQATAGLIDYRNGNPHRARECYIKSISTFRGRGNGAAYPLIIAGLFMAQEELRIEAGIAHAILDGLGRRIGDATPLEIRVMYDRLVRESRNIQISGAISDQLSDFVEELG